MSELPKNIELRIMKDSAAELVIAKRVAFMVSCDKTPFTLMISIAGLM